MAIIQVTKTQMHAKEICISLRFKSISVRQVIYDLPNYTHLYIMYPDWAIIHIHACVFGLRSCLEAEIFAFKDMYPQSTLNWYVQKRVHYENSSISQKYSGEIGSNRLQLTT